MKPTPGQFQAFQRIYDYFNQALFKSELPDVLLNFTRQNQKAGHFAPIRWKASTGQQTADKERTDQLFVTESGDTRHEIAIHPHCLFLGKNEFIQTLVHEMVHLWQHEYAHPSRSGYHNREWADKMESVGLIPSTTGKPGGQRTGQCMSDYLQVGGELARIIANMPSDLWLPFDALEYSAFNVTALEAWLNELGANTSATNDEIATVKQTLEELKQQKLKKRKMKYTCVSCGINIWGKPGLRLRCEDCDLSLLAVE